jgi:hypothetical protein
MPAGMKILTLFRAWFNWSCVFMHKKEVIQQTIIIRGMSTDRWFIYCPHYSVVDYLFIIFSDIQKFFSYMMVVSLYWLKRESRYIIQYIWEETIDLPKVNWQTFSHSHIGSSRIWTEAGWGWEISWYEIDVLTTRPRWLHIMSTSKMSYAYIVQFDHITSMRLPLKNKQYATLFSAYASTPSWIYRERQILLKTSQPSSMHSCSLQSTLADHKVIILGDFDTRVGQESAAWKGVLGIHGISNCIDNGPCCWSFSMSSNLSSPKLSSCKRTACKQPGCILGPNIATS